MFALALHRYVYDGRFSIVFFFGFKLNSPLNRLLMDNFSMLPPPPYTHTRTDSPLVEGNTLGKGFVMHRAPHVCLVW